VRNTFEGLLVGLLFLALFFLLLHALRLVAFCLRLLALHPLRRCRQCEQHRDDDCENNPHDHPLRAQPPARWITHLQSSKIQASSLVGRYRVSFSSSGNALILAPDVYERRTGRSKPLPLKVTSSRLSAAILSTNAEMSCLSVRGPTCGAPMALTAQP